MKRTIQTYLMCFLLGFVAFQAQGKAVTGSAKSPDGNVEVFYATDAAGNFSYSVNRGGVQVIAPSFPSMTLADGRVIARRAFRKPSGETGMERRKDDRRRHHNRRQKPHNPS